MSQKEEDLELSLREHLLRAAQAGAEESQQQQQQHHHHHQHRVLHQAHSQPQSQAQLASSLASPIASSGAQSLAGAQPSPAPSASILPDHITLGTIDPVISSGSFTISHQSANSSAGHNLERRKANRELSTSKRAAQNRAAQRAFRQRKEEYIKTLRERVELLEDEVEASRLLKREYDVLKDYTLLLQSKLLELHGEFPAPPASVDLTRPQHSAASESAQSRSQSQPQSQSQSQPQFQSQPQLQSQSHSRSVIDSSSTVPTAPMSVAAVDQLKEAAAKASRFEDSASTPEMDGNSAEAWTRQIDSKLMDESSEDYALKLSAALTSAGEANRAASPVTSHS